MDLLPPPSPGGSILHLRGALEEGAAPALPELLRRAMTACGLDRRGLVRALGYRNVAKGLRRVDGWLAGSTAPAAGQLVELAGALGVSETGLRAALRRDAARRERARRRERAADPRYRLVVRLVPGVYQQVQVEAADDGEALDLAREHVRLRGLPAVLDRPDGVLVWLDRDGVVTRIVPGEAPRTALGRRALPVAWVEGPGDGPVGGARAWSGPRASRTVAASDRTPPPLEDAP